MGILTRYLIRAHAGPFLFALSALTGLLFLNAVAMRLQDLAGKGLTFDIIREFLFLSLPHTLALTLPMAVLVSVLYAFSDLALNNEITAMKAGGIRPQRLLVPMLGVGAVLSLTMFGFNDRVLPEANHRLKNLLMDIGRKSPTLSLREQVVNRLEIGMGGERAFLQAGRIDNVSSTLYDVVIVDPADPLRYRTTVADSANMLFNEDRTDLYLVLFDGVLYVSSVDPPGSFQQLQFERQVVPFRGIGNEMERQASDSRSDREMTLAMLGERAREREESAAQIRDQNLERSRNAVLFALGHPVDDADVFTVSPALPTPYSDGALAAFSNLQSTQVAPPVGDVPDHVTRRLSAATRSSEVQEVTWRLSAAKYRVEIHKKYSLAVACFVFVLLGGPLAIRFPRGGLGMVIAASSFIFAIYWMGLIGGEQLADNGKAPPGLGMWIPNVVFAVVGLYLVKGMSREGPGLRGSGWDNVLYSARERLAKTFRRPTRANAGPEATT